MPRCRGIAGQANPNGDRSRVELSSPNVAYPCHPLQRGGDRGAGMRSSGGAQAPLDGARARKMSWAGPNSRSRTVRAVRKMEPWMLGEAGIGAMEPGFSHPGCQRKGYQVKRSQIARSTSAKACFWRRTIAGGQRFRILSKRTAVRPHYGEPRMDPTDLCTDELGPVTPRNLWRPPLAGPPMAIASRPRWSTVVGRRSLVYGALRVCDGNEHALCGCRIPRTTLNCSRELEADNPKGDIFSSRTL